jgi:hypothetical protein
MGFKFRKIIKVIPGVKINLSKSGISASIGGAGHTLNIGKKGIKTTVGIPGSGMSYSKNFKIKKFNNKIINPTPMNKNIKIELEKEPIVKSKGKGCLKFFIIILIIFFALVFFGWILSLFA